MNKSDSPQRHRVHRGSDTCCEFLLRAFAPLREKSEPYLKLPGKSQIQKIFTTEATDYTELEVSEPLSASLRCNSLLLTIDVSQCRFVLPLQIRS